jgi:hypothetical protein
MNLFGSKGSFMSGIIPNSTYIRMFWQNKPQFNAQEISTSTGTVEIGELIYMGVIPDEE